MKYYHTEINGAWIGAFIIVPVTGPYGIVTRKCCAITLRAVYLNQSMFMVVGAGLSDLQYYHIEIVCCFVMCSRLESEYLLQLLLKAWELIVLKL